MNTDFFFRPFPSLDLGDIVLRAISEYDAQDYFDYMNHPAMIPFLADEHKPNTVEISMSDMHYWSNLFNDKRSVYWAIATQDSNKMIGTIGFNVISFPHARADISYDLNVDFWGKGIMLKSMKAILNFSDVIMGLVRIQAMVIHHNEKSIKLLERCGFYREGLMKKYELVNKEYQDHYLYSRISC